MSIITDLYTSLFGRTHIQDGTVIDMAEHGRVGGLSTGQSFKHVSIVDATTGTANPIPTGAATSAKQDTQTTLLQGIAGMIPSAYDYISQTIGSTSKTFVFKNGGSGGTVVSTIVINYTDTTLNTMSSVVKT